MDAAARKVLKTKKGVIVGNLILDDRILDSLEEKGILTEDMIQTVKAERTDNERITKLLFILTRRGPNAFREFLEAIRPHFGFLSNMLEESYSLELENWNSANPGSSQEVASPMLSRRNSTEIDMESRPSLCRNCSQQVTPSNDTNDKEKSISGTHVFMHQMLQESLQCWYTKLKSHLTNYNLRELSFNSPAPVTSGMVEKLLDELIQTVDKCYKVLGVKENLVSQVINLKESERKLIQEIKQKEEQKNKYADNIMKLENKCRDNCEKIETLERNNQKLHAKILTLEEENRAKLEQKDNEIEEITEKYENAIEELKKMEQTLEDAKTKIERLEGNIISYEKNTGVYNFQIQGATYKTKRSDSRKNFSDDRSFVHQQTKTIRKSKHSMNAEATLTASNIATAGKHSQSQETTELIAVEEPDSSRMRTRTVIENCYQMSSVTTKNTEGIKSAASNKENYAPSGEIQTLKDKNQFDETQEKSLQLIVNTSENVNDTSGETVTAIKCSHSRRTNMFAQPKAHGPLGRKISSIGTYGPNVNRGVRRANNVSPTVLKTLMIVNHNTNNGLSMQTESPRGPKAQKKSY